MEIKKGDIFWIENSRGAGSEQIGTRPALVVSNDMGNQNAPVVTVVWLTSQKRKPLPTHCEVKAFERSIALCENVTTVSKERMGGYIRTATQEEMENVDQCLRIALGLVEYKTKEQMIEDRKPVRENIDEMVAILGVEPVIGYLRCNVYQADGEKRDYYMRKLNELKGVCNVRTVHESYKR